MCFPLKVIVASQSYLHYSVIFSSCEVIPQDFFACVLQERQEKFAKTNPF